MEIKTNVELNIYKASKKDLKAITNLLLLCWKNAYKEILPSSHLQKISFNEKYTYLTEEMNNNSIIYNAHVNDELIGIIILRKEKRVQLPGNNGEISNLYVHPKYLGNGYGTQLLKFAIEELKIFNYQNVCAWTFSNNTVARLFYEKNGLYFDGNIRPYPFAEKNFLVRYVKKL